MIECVQFLGRDFVLVEGGAITTVEAYNAGEVSYAHLCEDGLIRRYGEVIGKQSDITFTGKPFEPDSNMLRRLKGILSSPTWESRD